MDASSLHRRGHAVLRLGRMPLPHHAYHLTLVSVGRDACFLQPMAAVVASACFEERVLLGDATMLAWVLMPDHAHLLVRLGEGGGLSQLVNRLKSASARRTNALLGRQGAIWNRGYHDRALRREDDLRTVAGYIVANPVRAGLVEAAEDYPYWNTAWGRCSL